MHCVSRRRVIRHLHHLLVRKQFLWKSSVFLTTACGEPIWSLMKEIGTCVKPYPSIVWLHWLACTLLFSLRAILLPLLPSQVEFASCWAIWSIGQGQHVSAIKGWLWWLVVLQKVQLLKTHCLSGVPHPSPTVKGTLFVRRATSLHLLYILWRHVCMCETLSQLIHSEKESKTHLLKKITCPFFLQPLQP